MTDAPDLKEDEVAETPAHPGGKGFDWLQIAFWTSLAVAGGAAGVALTWSQAVGPSGAVLVIALGAMALVLTLWLMKGAGRRLGIFPERGAAEARRADHPQAGVARGAGGGRAGLRPRRSDRGG